MELTWSDLIERAKADDQDAFYQLYQNSYDAVYRTVKSMIRDDDMAMDIVQDSFVKGFSNLSELESPDSFVSWMRRIAVNKAKDWFKKKQEISFSQMADEEGNEPDFEDERAENMPEAVVDRNETARLVDEILNGLSDEQRIAVGMYYYQNMSVAEIAEELAVSENTVKSRLNYGRKKIKTSVEELEKKGTKLYSLSPVAFLVFLFRNQIAQAAVGGAPEAAFGAIMAKTGVAVGNAAAASAAGAEAAASTAMGAGTSGVAGAATSAAGAAMSAGATGAATSAATGAAVSAGAAAGAAKAGIFASLGAKILAGVLAASVAAGAVGLGLHLSHNGAKHPVIESSPLIESVPGTEGLPDPLPEKDFVVLPGGYEEVNSIAVAEVADVRVFLAKKGGKWGVVDETGKAVVPFAYDWISSPTASGHLLAERKDPDTQKTVYTVFDSQGKEIYTASSGFILGNDILITREVSFDGGGDLDTFSHITVKQLSTGKTVLTEEYACEVSISNFEDCFVVSSATDPNVNYSGYLTFYNSKGEVLRQVALYDATAEWYTSTWGGYYVSAGNYSRGGVQITSLDGTKDYSYGWDELEDVYYEYYDRVGTLMLLGCRADNGSEGNGKEYLLDIATLPNSYEDESLPDYFLTGKGYDDISTNALEKWFLVTDGAKQGFLSRDGKTERLYDSAGDFVRGKAVVRDGGEVYVVDDSMNVISDKLTDGYTSVKTLGEGLYGVEKDGVWYLAVYKG